MIKSLLCLPLLYALAAAPAGAAPSFELEAGVRLSSASVHAVRPISGGYRMYFSTPSHFAVFSATSTDGLAWTIEPGVRISTPMGGFYSSSITALGAYEGASIATGPYRAYYVGLSSTGVYSVLSATSTDGLNRGRDPDFLMQFGGGGQRVLSLAPYFIGSGKAALYYARDDGSANPSSYAVYLATSSDSGNSFSGETRMLASTGTYHVAVSTLTNGKVRLFATATLGAGSTTAMLLAADSPDGLSFPTAPVTVFSTGPASNELTGIGVVRSTDAYSWRLYLSSRLDQSATTYIHSALTMAPVLTAFTPNLAYDNDLATNFTVTGEVFAPAVSLFTLTGPAPMSVNTVTRVSDIQLTVNATPNGAPLGSYTATVTNPDGRSGVLAAALTVDYRPGYVGQLDNLFRPLSGGLSRVDATIFTPGVIKADIYTINGALVKKLYNAPAAVGMTTFFWNGATEGGRTAASGLYLLHITGPKLKETKKIVLIN